jgi:hypothetical protein
VVQEQQAGPLGSHCTPAPGGVVHEENVREEERGVAREEDAATSNCTVPLYETAGLCWSVYTKKCDARTRPNLLLIELLPASDAHTPPLPALQPNIAQFCDTQNK